MTAGELYDELSRRLATGSLDRSAKVELLLHVADCIFEDDCTVGAEFEECSEPSFFILGTNKDDLAETGDAS